MDIKGLVFTAVGIVLALYLFVNMIPDTIETWVAVNTTNWTGGSGALWNIAPMIAIIGVILVIIGLAVSHYES